MNETNENDAYLIDFYSPSHFWFPITVGTISVFIVFSNIFFIAITLTSKTLRSTSSNWILVGFAISDVLHGLAHLSGNIITLWIGSPTNRYPCSLTGTFIIFTFTTSDGFPFLIAADRYYKITVPESGKFSLGSVLFSNRYTIPLIVGWYCLSALGNLPLLLNNGFGEDPGGWCGAKKFTDVRILLMYEFWGMGVFCMSLCLATFYYFRLAKWLKDHQQTTNVDGANHTRQIMRVTKIITIIPVVLGTTAVIVDGGQMLLPDLPMWIRSAITTPYFLTPVANPWLTICLIRPFRRRVLQILRKVKIVAVADTTERIGHYSLNRQQKTTSEVHPIAIVDLH